MASHGGGGVGGAMVVGGEYKTDEDVRAYVRKRKRANKNCSVSHLRRALNIGYKKAKRIHDEVDDELRRERGGLPFPRRRSSATDEDEDDGDEDEEDVSDAGEGRGDEDEDGDEDEETARGTYGRLRSSSSSRSRGGRSMDDGDGDARLLEAEENLREHIRSKLRHGEVIFVHQLRDLGLSYRRTRRILQEFIDQGKIQKLPKSALTCGRRGSAVEEGHAGEEPVKVKPLKQKVKEENKKAAENHLNPKTDSDETSKRDDHMADGHQAEGTGAAPTTLPSDSFSSSPSDTSSIQTSSSTSSFSAPSPSPQPSSSPSAASSQSDADAIPVPGQASSSSRESSGEEGHPETAITTASDTPPLATLREAMETDGSSSAAAQTSADASPPAEPAPIEDPAGGPASESSSSSSSSMDVDSHSVSAGP